MKIILPGGSGHVGQALTRAFLERGDDVVILSRHAAPPQPRLRTVAWDGVTLGPWAAELEGADVVINLAGRSVNCRYHAQNRRQIMDSRVLSTGILGRAIAQAAQPPKLWLQSGTATIYAHRFEAPNDEDTGILGGNEPGVPETWRFRIEVAKAWEREFNHAETPATRKVILRSAMVMSPDRGGIFATMSGIARAGFGGAAGNGRQYISWIHEADFIRAIDWLIQREHFTGPVNLASPNPLPNRDFMKALREAWGAPIGLSATRWMLELGAVFLRTETELILKSRRVVPGRLLKDGFTFQFPDWPAAARDLREKFVVPPSGGNPKR